MKECIIGIDFGKTNMRFGIAEDKPELKCFTKQSYVRGSPDEIFQQIFKGVDAALKESGYDPRGVLGVGIDVPAVVNRETGVIVWGPDWDFMAGASLTRPISERYGVPVVADVDPVMATWGEQWAGVGRTCNRFAILTWGTGLGAGLVLNGEVQENPNNLFPEFGHSTVSDDDWPCKCGSQGCVDTMVCGGGIANHGRLAVQDGKKTMLREMCGHDSERVTSPMVFDAAEKGDEVARAILERVGVLIGRLCANVVLTVQPEKIVIVGGLTERCDWVLGTINRTMRDKCWLLFKGLTRCEVVASGLGDTAGVLGAVYKVRRMIGKTKP
jgi:predicted NBD/HSP70 family sugar kinase